MSYILYPPIGSPKAFKARHKHDWTACEGSYYVVGGIDKACMIRCSKCNRRLKAQTICGHDNYISFMIPRHKSKK